jgi:hypothetical protein
MDELDQTIKHRQPGTNKCRISEIPDGPRGMPGGYCDFE